MTGAPWPEWTMLELLCPGTLSGDRLEQFRELARGTIDYGVLLNQGLRHRMLMLLGEALDDEAIAAAAPAQIRGELLGMILANRRRVAVLTRSAVKVTERLTAAGIRVAATKGVVLEPTVYGGLGLRKMMDADLVIAPADRQAVTALLGEIGYQQGVYSWREHRIDPLPARRRAEFRLSPDHLPHFRMLDSDGAGVVTIDFANSLTWAASAWQVDMDAALARPVPVEVLGGEAVLPALEPAYRFLSVTLHLFRESWFEESIARGKDMLYKYADVLRLWQAHGEELAKELPEPIDRYDLGRPVGWVLAHTDRMFGTTIAAALGLGAELTDQWLGSASAAGGGELRWPGDMRARLQAADRMALMWPSRETS